MKTIKVLVVDDAAFVRDLVKKGIRAQFPAFHLAEASDGQMAKARLEQDSFDLVLCDWEMPKMSGDELLQWMRSNEQTAGVPFVMITSRGDRENVMRAVELKADNYIVKPFTADKLLGVITKVLSRSLKVSPDALKKRGGAAPAMPLAGELPIAATLTSAEAAPAKAPPARKESAVRVIGKVLAQLRFSGNTIQCLVKEVGVQRLVGVIRRDDNVPGILDLAVFDLETDDGEISRINGYVHTLQARERSQETEFINLTVEFIDQDEVKLAHLRKYMRQVGG